MNEHWEAFRLQLKDGVTRDQVADIKAPLSERMRPASAPLVDAFAGQPQNFI